MGASPTNQMELKVKWSLERLNDGNEETQSQNAHYLADIPSNQENAAQLREMGVVPNILETLRTRAWPPGSDVPATLARTLNNIFKQDEAACGQARSCDGAGILAAILFDVASQAEAEATLWETGRINEAAAQTAEALTTLVEVHTESQVAACGAGAVHAALQLLQSPQSVRRRATDLLRELLAGIAAAPDASVFDAFAKELPVVFVQLHGLLAQHSRVWARLLPVQEAVLCDILSEVVAHPECRAKQLEAMLPHVLALVGVFVHCRQGRNARFPPEVEQALANALLAIVADEGLAAKLREDPPTFEMLRGFQAGLTSPLAAAAVKQMLAQLQSFVTAL